MLFRNAFAKWMLVATVAITGFVSNSCSANSNLPDIYVNNSSLFLTNMNFDPNVETSYHIYTNQFGTTGVHVALWSNGQVIDETWAGFEKGKVTFVVVHGGIGTDHVFNESGLPSRMFGGPGNDTLIGGSDIDELYGGDGDDTLDGFVGDDYINGDDGNDMLAGEAGNDKLFGGQGLDVITGGDGEDWIDGGGDGEPDHLTGDQDEGLRFVDTFVLHTDPETGVEAESIQDFDNNYVVKDKLHLTKF